MGTNFYKKHNKKHIGKRSAAGWYCWDCGITLCKDGNEAIHQGTSGWHKQCPECNTNIPAETLVNSSAGRELGFNTDPPQKKTGVASCSSFTWAISNSKLRCVVADEYGRTFTAEQFRAMLEECPIQYTQSIGREFS